MAKSGCLQVDKVFVLNHLTAYVEPDKASGSEQEASYQEEAKGLPERDRFQVEKFRHGCVPEQLKNRRHDGKKHDDEQ